MAEGIGRQEHVAEAGGESVGDLTWRDDDPIRPGARVEASDGPLGVVRQRRVGEGPEHAYVGVETDEGLLWVPDRLIRETRGSTVLLSLPTADVKANASHGGLPVQPDPASLPVERR